MIENDKTNNATNDKAKINRETAKMHWHELQRFFAKGDVLYLDSGEDLVKVAYQMANDNLPAIQDLMQANKLYLVNDDMAKNWHETDALLWTVVIKPWILVQPTN